jgi:glycosyltransferase involved in cell wall biosynthesis
MQEPVARAKPFLRWAGSKRKQLSRLGQFWTASHLRYVEPFAGSACLFFELAPVRAVLGDNNSSLIEVYCLVRDQPDRLYDRLRRIRREPETYYRWREKQPHRLDIETRVVRFIYLNRNCFNGIYRLNEKVATADPRGRVDPFTRFVGWQSQDDLPGHIRESAMLVMPTIAQEALGRTAVEAMAAGRPVVASRLGGLPFTVVDGATGLLCEPGDADDLARKIEMLLDDADLRERLGLAGRRRFEEHYAWPVIIEHHYKPLLGEPTKATTRETRR